MFYKKKPWLDENLNLNAFHNNKKKLRLTIVLNTDGQRLLIREIILYCLDNTVIIRYCLDNTVIIRYCLDNTMIIRYCLDNTMIIRYCLDLGEKYPAAYAGFTATWKTWKSQGILFECLKSGKSQGIFKFLGKCQGILYVVREFFYVGSCYIYIVITFTIIAKFSQIICLMHECLFCHYKVFLEVSD